MAFSSRHLIWINLILLALVAYGAASTVNGAVATRLSPPVHVELSPAPPPIAKEPHRPAHFYAAVRNRDIFNATPPEVVPVQQEAPKQTVLKLKLWGVAVRDDGSSYCIIEDLAIRKQRLYAVGDLVADTATVKVVEWDRVVLDRNGNEEILELEKVRGSKGGRGKKGGKQPPAPARNARRSNTSVQDRKEERRRQLAERRAERPTEEDPHIRLIGDNSYSIDKSEVDGALDNMSQLFTQMRVVPHFQGGKSTGFRLFAIRQNSLFDRIGLRNGDIIQRVNGNEIDDPTKALGLLGRLRNEREILVDLIRNKKPTKLSYEIN